jgi:putative transposase
VILGNPKSQDEEDGLGLGHALDELARQGARRMIAAALKVEADDYVARFAEDRGGDGRALVVRNGSPNPRCS